MQSTARTHVGLLLGCVALGCMAASGIGFLWRGATQGAPGRTATSRDDSVSDQKRGTVNGGSASQELAMTVPSATGGFRVTPLSAEIVEMLSGRHENLFLEGVTTLSAESAAALARHPGQIVLADLTTLEPEAARELAKHRGLTLAIGSRCAPSPETLAALALHERVLALDGLTTLSARAARALSLHRGMCLSLRYLTAIEPDAARELARYRGTLNLNGLTTLAAESARAFGDFKGFALTLYGLTSLSDEAAETLRMHPAIQLPEQFRSEPQVQEATQVRNVRDKRVNRLLWLGDVGRLEQV